MAFETIDPSADQDRGAVVLTSIAPPNDVMRRIASDCRARGMRFYVVGDTKSPADFELDGCDFFSVDAQVASGSRHAQLCPTRHYARKNFGYLMAMRQPIDFIVETDDDNMPSDDFYRPLPVDLDVPSVSGGGWVNVYRYFTDRLIWPRGLPLDTINAPLAEPVGGQLVRARSSRASRTRIPTSMRSSGSSCPCRSASRRSSGWCSGTAPGARSTARTRPGGERLSRFFIFQLIARFG